jgi:hypothetical protein
MIVKTGKTKTHGGARPEYYVTIFGVGGFYFRQVCSQSIRKYPCGVGVVYFFCAASS